MVADTISKCLLWVHRSGKLGSSWQGSNGNQQPEVEPAWTNTGEKEEVKSPVHNQLLNSELIVVVNSIPMTTSIFNKHHVLLTGTVVEPPMLGLRGYPVTEDRVLVISVYKLVQEVTKRRDFSVGWCAGGMQQHRQSHPVLSIFLFHPRANPARGLESHWHWVVTTSRKRKVMDPTQARVMQRGMHSHLGTQSLKEGKENPWPQKISLCAIPNHLQESLPSLPSTVSCPWELAVISCSAHWNWCHAEHIAVQARLGSGFHQCVMCGSWAWLCGITASTHPACS